MRLWTRTVLAGAAAAAVALPVQLGMGHPAGAATLTPVKIGIQPQQSSAGLFWAIKMGYFKRHGLDLQPVIYPNTPAKIQALQANVVQFANGDNVTVIAAVANAGVNLKIVAPDNGISRNDSIRMQKDDKFAFLVDPTTLCMKNDTKISGWKDLEGKTFAINARAGGVELAIRRLVRKSGGNPDLIKFAVIPSPATLAAVKSGNVDVGLATKPFAEQCDSDPDTKVWGHVIGSYYTVGGPQQVVFTTGPYYNANPQIVRAFQAASYEYIRDTKLAKNKASLAQSAAELTKTPLQDILNSYPINYWNAPLTRDWVQGFVDDMVAEKFIRQRLDARGLIIPQYVPATRTRLA